MKINTVPPEKIGQLKYVTLPYHPIISQVEQLISQADDILGNKVVPRMFSPVSRQLQQKIYELYMHI